MNISHTTALEIADNWEQMAASETGAHPARRETLRECADLIRMMVNREPETCPHAEAPFRFCYECPVKPCPLGIGGKAQQ